MTDEYDLNKENEEFEMLGSDIHDGDEISGENPFDEEFSVVDVVNKHNVIKEDSFRQIEENDDLEGLPEETGEIESKGNLDIDSLLNYDEEKNKQDKFEGTIGKQLDVDSITGYSDEKRKEKFFEYENGILEKPVSDEDRLQNNFKDFLIARKISGNLSGITHHCYIPSDRIKKSDSKVEIADEEGHDDTSKVAPQAVFHRNAENVIESIEIFCTCGEKILLKLDYESVGDDLDSASYEIPLTSGPEAVDEDFNNDVLLDETEPEGLPEDEIITDEDFAGDIPENEFSDDIADEAGQDETGETDPFDDVIDTDIPEEIESEGPEIDAEDFEDIDIPEDMDDSGNPEKDIIP